MKTSTTIGAIFEILEKNLYNAILRIASPEERINAGMVYETIWTWFIKDFENEKAGITEAIQKGEYARKLMNPKRGCYEIDSSEGSVLTAFLLSSFSDFLLLGFIFGNSSEGVFSGSSYLTNAFVFPPI